MNIGAKAVATFGLISVVLSGCGKGESPDTRARDACEATAGVGNCVERQAGWVALGSIQGTTSTTAASPVSSAPTTTAPVTPTTVTTVKQPQGTLEWQDLGRVSGDAGLGPPCSLNEYRLINRSDTAILDVTIKGVHMREWHDGAPNGVLDTITFPAQTIAAGIPAFGETTISVNWCSNKMSAGSDSFFAMTDNRATISWHWVQ